MHIMRIFWFSFCRGFIYLLFLTILLSAILWLQNMSTQCLALEPSHCRETGAQDSPLKKSGAEVKPSAASRRGTRPGCIDQIWIEHGKFLDLEDSWHLRDTVRGFWGWLGFWKTFEDSKHENGKWKNECRKNGQDDNNKWNTAFLWAQQWLDSLQV